MKICPKCKSEYEEDVQFCSRCGTTLVEKEKVSFCQFCGAVLDKEAVFCSHCGRSPDGSMVGVSQQQNLQSQAQYQQTVATPVMPQPSVNPPPSVPKVSMGEKFCRWWSDTKIKAGTGLAALKADKKKLYTLTGIVVALIIAGGAGFYAYGPTLHHVQTMAAAKDSSGLVKLVAGRSHSRFFSGVTQQAVREIIKINKIEDVKSLSQYVMDEGANVDQKKAIITAFTDENVVVPYFYKVFDKAGTLRNLVIENGTKQNPDIFKDKMYGDMDGILDQCRNEFGDYDEKIEHLKIYNVGEFVPAAAFDNLKGITKLYTIQQAVKTNNNDNILKALDQFKTMTDANLIAKNTQFFNQIAAKIQDKKSATANIQSYNSELAGLNTEQKVASEQSAMQDAKNKINAMNHINYYGKNYMDDGRLAIIIPGGGYAVISNPRGTFNHFVYYSDYVGRMGTTTIYDNYGSYNVPLYEIKDVTPLLSVINEHQRNIDAFYAQEQGVKDKINVAIAGRDAANQQAGDLMNGMLVKLNNIKTQDLIAFSSGKVEPPAF